MSRKPTITQTLGVHWIGNPFGAYESYLIEREFKRYFREQAKHRKLTTNAVEEFIKTARPGKKIYDGDGLHLFMLKSRNATWRVKYRIFGSERSYSIGVYPKIGIEEARLELWRVKRLVSRGIDPVAERRARRISGRPDRSNERGIT